MTVTARAPSAALVVIGLQQGILDTAAEAHAGSVAALFPGLIFPVRALPERGEAGMAQEIIAPAAAGTGSP